MQCVHTATKTIFSFLVDVYMLKQDTDFYFLHPMVNMDAKKAEKMQIPSQ